MINNKNDNHCAMRKLFILLLLAPFATVAHGQLLWRVTGGNCYKPSYLFGTIHMQSSNFIDSVPGLSDVITSVDAIYGEVVQDEMMSKSVVSKVLKESLAPADSTIDRLLTPQEYKMVDDVVKNYMMGLIGLDRLSKLKPMAIVMQLEAMQVAKHFPNFKSLAGGGIDMAVQSRGSELGKYVGGFETIEQQLAIAYGSTLQEQAHALVEMCAKDKEFADNNRRLSALYHSQDLKALEQFLLDPSTGMSAESMERLSYSRNRKWMDKIVATLPVQSMLIVVGAAHLVGDQGLIELLRSRGYVVEAVDAP